MVYEIKLLTDYETLNTNYLSYYVNENMPETKFYLCDDINIHVFLTNLLGLIEQNKVTNLDFNTNPNHRPSKLALNTRFLPIP